MLDVVDYLRKELVRLERVTDDEIMHGGLEGLKFGILTETTDVRLDNYRN